jgi:hypothetical protein
MKEIKSFLFGKDLRSIAQVDELISLVKTQSYFDALFEYLYSEDRLLVMGAVDAVEKISKNRPEYLSSHKTEIIKFFKIAKNKEFKWHLAQLVTRLHLSLKELKTVWNKLATWTTDKNESKIVRVNSVQALFELSKKFKDLKADFCSIIQEVERENISSLNARIRKLKSK